MAYQKDVSTFKRGQIWWVHEEEGSYFIGNRFSDEEKPTLANSILRRK